MLFYWWFLVPDFWESRALSDRWPAELLAPLALLVSLLLLASDLDLLYLEPIEPLCWVFIPPCDICWRYSDGYEFSSRLFRRYWLIASSWPNKALYIVPLRSFELLRWEARDPAPPGPEWRSFRVDSSSLLCCKTGFNSLLFFPSCE